MALARSVLERLKSSDGRIRVKTLSGVSALVTAIALLVGVLPVMADHPQAGVNPGNPIDLGGGSGGCEFVTSAASESLHLNNPVSGIYTGSDGTQIRIVVSGRLFSFKVLDPGKAVYDVTVNGGSKSNHYNYDGDLGTPVIEADNLHAPNNPQGTPHNLSHVNICYDGATEFECGEEVKLEQQGLFAVGTVTIFGNSLWECEDKLGAFVVDNDPDDPYVLIDFGTGGGVVAGIATFKKEFGEGMPPFVPLQYSLTATSDRANVNWCDIRAKAFADGDQFNTWLPNNKYPSLDGVTDDLNLADGAIACKVYEEEDITGTQFTVVYFEFEDPQFR